MLSSRTGAWKGRGVAAQLCLGGVVLLCWGFASCFLPAVQLLGREVPAGSSFGVVVFPPGEAAAGCCGGRSALSSPIEEGPRGRDLRY